MPARGEAVHRRSPLDGHGPTPMPPPILHTARLRLRPWSEDDATAFHGLWGDPRVTWWESSHSARASQRKLEGVLARCAAMPEGLGWWAVEERGTDRIAGRVVGNAVLQPAPYDETAELGYHLAHDFWGRGYASEAAGAALRHAISTLALPVVSAVVHVDNHASHRVATRIGLREIGPMTFKGMPHLLYRITREEALALEWPESAGI